MLIKLKKTGKVRFCTRKTFRRGTVAREPRASEIFNSPNDSFTFKVKFNGTDYERAVRPPRAASENCPCTRRSKAWSYYSRARAFSYATVARRPMLG